MKRFKAYDTHQSYLLPPSPQEWLPDDHLAYFIDNVVDQLDLSEVFAGYEGTKGQPPYHPQMMIGVWLYGYCVGIRSSRRLNAPCTRTSASECCRVINNRTTGRCQSSVVAIWGD